MRATMNLPAFSHALNVVKKGAVIPLKGNKPKKLPDGTTAPLEYRRVCVETVKGNRKKDTPPCVRLTTYDGTDLTEEEVSVLPGDFVPGACWVNVDTLREWVALGNKQSTVTLTLDGDTLVVCNERNTARLPGEDISDIPENAYDAPIAVEEEKQAA